MLVQALVAKPAVEWFAHRVIRGLSWPAEVELHAGEGCPPIQAPRDKFRTVVDPDRLRPTAMRSHLLQDANDVVPGQPLTGLNGQPLTALVID